MLCKSSEKSGVKYRNLVKLPRLIRSLTERDSTIASKESARVTPPKRNGVAVTPSRKALGKARKTAL